MPTPCLALAARRPLRPGALASAGLALVSALGLASSASAGARCGEHSSAACLCLARAESRPSRWGGVAAAGAAPRRAHAGRLGRLPHSHSAIVPVGFGLHCSAPQQRFSLLGGATASTNRSPQGAGPLLRGAMVDGRGGSNQVTWSVSFVGMLRGITLHRALRATLRSVPGRACIRGEHKQNGGNNTVSAGGQRGQPITCSGSVDLL